MRRNEYDGFMKLDKWAILSRGTKIASDPRFLKYVEPEVIAVLLAISERKCVDVAPEVAVWFNAILRKEPGTFYKFKGGVPGERLETSRVSHIEFLNENWMLVKTKNSLYKIDIREANIGTKKVLQEIEERGERLEDYKKYFKEIA